MGLTTRSLRVRNLNPENMENSKKKKKSLGKQSLHYCIWEYVDGCLIRYDKG